MRREGREGRREERIQVREAELMGQGKEGDGRGEWTRGKSRKAVKTGFLEKNCLQLY